MIHRIRTLALLSGLATGLAAPLAAQAGEIQCHANKAYNVAVREYDDEPGSQFAITARKGAAAQTCSFDAKTASVVIGQGGDPLWFGELTEELLVATRSTGPQGDLVVFELSSGKKLLDVPADEYEIAGDRLSFWQRAGEATKANCPEFAENEKNGFGSVVLEHVVFNLRQRTIEKDGQQRCGATQ